MKKSKYKSKLDMNDPEVISSLEKAAQEAKEFSDKFVKARIIPYEMLHRHMTI
jgi:hypothetical protein